MRLSLPRPHILTVSGRHKYLPILESSPAAQHHFSHAPFHFPTFERRPAAACELLGRPNLVLSLLIHLDPRLWLLWQLEDPPWVVMHLGDQVIDRQSPIRGCGEKKGQRRFQPREAGRRIF